MHPRQCDSINRMANLPQFHEWVAARLKEDKTLGKGGTPGLPPAEAGMQDVAGAPEEAMTSTGGRQSRVHPEPPEMSRGTSLSTIFQNTMDDWEQMIKDVPTDELLKDGSMCVALREHRTHHALWRPGCSLAWGAHTALLLSATWQ